MGGKKTAKNRIWELDFLRGLAILLVLVDHSMFDFSYSFSFWSDSGVVFLDWLNAIGTKYMYSEIRYFWRPAFLFLFFCTSGLCTAFSRDNFLRGVRLAAVAAAVSLITYLGQSLFDMEIFILFGVLHCMAAIILIYSVVAFIVRYSIKIGYRIAKKESNVKVEHYVLSAACLILSAVFLIINNKFNVSLDDVHRNYATLDTANRWIGILFFTDNWWTADYFPLFPFISFFFFGAGLTQILYPNKKSLLPALDDGVWNKPFTVAGKYSLFIYLAGQVVVIGVCALLSLIFTGKAF